MRTLKREQYDMMLRDRKHMKKQISSVPYYVKWMEQWDDARTDLNPGARWYGEQPEEEGNWQETGEKGKYICSNCKELYKIPTVLCYPQWRFCPNCGQKNMEV